MVVVQEHEINLFINFLMGGGSEKHSKCKKKKNYFVRL